MSRRPSSKVSNIALADFMPRAKGGCGYLKGKGGDNVENSSIEKGLSYA